MPPDAGVAVGLQLESHRGAPRARPRILLHARGGPQQVLHVMAELVRDHVCLGKIARGAEPRRDSSLKNPRSRYTL